MAVTNKGKTLLRSLRSFTAIPAAAETLDSTWERYFSTIGRPRPRATRPAARPVPHPGAVVPTQEEPSSLTRTDEWTPVKHEVTGLTYYCECMF